MLAAPSCGVHGAGRKSVFRKGHNAGIAAGTHPRQDTHSKTPTARLARGLASAIFQPQHLLNESQLPHDPPQTDTSRPSAVMNVCCEDNGGCMFGWRKRNDGFEWRDYVRTTILVRRERRRQMVEELREAAVNKVKDAGERGLKAGAAGAQKVGQAAKAGLAEAGRSLDDNMVGLKARARQGGAKLATGLRTGAGTLGIWLQSELARKGSPWLAGFAAFWAAARYSSHGVDQEVTIAAAIAVAAATLGAILSLLAAGSGTAMGEAGDRLRTVAHALFDERGGTVAAAAAALVALVIGWSWLGASPTTGIASRSSPAAAAAESVSGRAVAVTGDTLRIGGRLVRLAGIEAPEREQRCTLESGRPWGCGSAATQALAALVKSGVVSCDLTRTGAAGPSRGLCRAGGKDIGAQLVEAGHVFAETGWFARYASEEATARDSKAGLWRGEPERPSEYRSKRWAEASKSAPDGCPIKGQKTSNRRTYLLPWSPQYERVKVREARGERWFCSEEEAQAAGWVPREQT